MTIDNQIKDKKLQCDIKREAAKISALSSGKIGKYEYLTGEEILPSNQKQIIDQVNLIIHLLERLLKTKQIKLNIMEKNKSKQLKNMENS